MFGFDIVIIEPLNDERSRFQVGCVERVIAFGIFFVVIMTILVLELIEFGDIGCIVILDLVPIFLIKDSA